MFLHKSHVVCDRRDGPCRVLVPRLSSFVVAALAEPSLRTSTSLVHTIATRLRVHCGPQRVAHSKYESSDAMDYAGSFVAVRSCN